MSGVENCPFSQDVADSVFLGQRHAEQFRALSQLTGAAVDILTPEEVEPSGFIATLRQRRTVAAALGDVSIKFETALRGPLPAEEALFDFNKKRASLPEGTHTIVSDNASAPHYPAPQGDTWLSFDMAQAGTQAHEYLRRPHSQEFLSIATGRFGHYYLAASRVNTRPNEPLIIRMPIGEYGPDAAIDIGRAAYQAMVKPTEEQLKRLNELGEEGDNRELILAHTTFGRNQRVTSPPGDTSRPVGNALALSVSEGDLSLQQNVGTLLTAEKVEGFPTLAGLWETIREAKLEYELTRLLPFGHLANANIMNAYIPGLVQPDSKQGVALSPERVQQLKDLKARVQAGLVKFHRKYPTEAATEDMGIFCPALARDGGLSVRNDVIYRNYRSQRHDFPSKKFRFLLYNEK